MFGSGHAKPYFNCERAKCLLLLRDRDGDRGVGQLPCNLSIRLGEVNLEDSCLLPGLCVYRDRWSEKGEKRLGKGDCARCLEVSLYWGFVLLPFHKKPARLVHCK